MSFKTFSCKANLLGLNYCWWTGLIKKTMFCHVVERILVKDLKHVLYTSNFKFYAPKTNQQLITTRPWGWRFATKFQQTWHNPHHGPGNWIMIESHLVRPKNPFHHIKLLPFFQSFTWRSCFLFQDAERDEEVPNFWQGLTGYLGRERKGGLATQLLERDPIKRPEVLAASVSLIDSSPLGWSPYAWTDKSIGWTRSIPSMIKCNSIHLFFSGKNGEDIKKRFHLQRKNHPKMPGPFFLATGLLI